MLHERDTFGICGSSGAPEKKFSIHFTKEKKAFLSLHYNSDNSYLFINGKEIFKFKAYSRNVNFPTQFCLQNIFNSFIAIVSREVTSNGNVYDF